PRTIDEGRVHLLNVIGNGAYGVVFYAIDYRYEPKGVKRAVKQLRRHNIDDRQRRFQQREIALHWTARDHPSIINMDRLVTEDDGIYVVMDYGDEGDLFAMITEKHRYAGDDLLIKKVFLQILDGVEHLHMLGIAHRDVKPENIVCSNDGTVVRIVDFGLATRDTTSTEFGCGSTFYIAPECLGEWDNARCYTTQTADVWSLGVILVNLVCGRNPWRCASPTDESFTAFLADPTFLRRILPISQECLDILTQIFTPEPEQRISLDRLRTLVCNIVSF
ncbi:kinase-like protein, partial [Cutaneotrichosporon oleaginosum]